MFNNIFIKNARYFPYTTVMGVTFYEKEYYYKIVRLFYDSRQSSFCVQYVSDQYNLEIYKLGGLDSAPIRFYHHGI